MNTLYILNCFVYGVKFTMSTTFDSNLFERNKNWKNIQIHEKHIHALIYNFGNSLFSLILFVERKMFLRGAYFDHWKEIVNMKNNVSKDNRKIQNAQQLTSTNKQTQSWLLGWKRKVWLNEIKAIMTSSFESINVHTNYIWKDPMFPQQLDHTWKFFLQI